MDPCFFATDLHGRRDRWLKLLEMIEREGPAGVFLGGDLLPAAFAGSAESFPEWLADRFLDLRHRMGERAPEVFLILGNDDPAAEEPYFRDAAAGGAWHYAHGAHERLGAWDVYGYACVPPTPFGLKDWERYDVSRYVPPGCVSPEEGRRTVPVPEHEIRYATIQKDLDGLVGDADLAHAIVLFHSPPHETHLDRAALDGRSVDHVPLDLHVGSIAVRRFIERRQPLLTLHGHIHESARLTGEWRHRLGRTWAFSAAHDGPELALVRFDPARPEAATRELL